LITGETNGIGKATAYKLSRLVFSITIVGQSANKSSSVAEIIQRTTGNNVNWIASDLSTLDGIRSTASYFKQNIHYLYIPVNNAGALLISE